ncbi:hypothetical protein YPPY96_3474, partial [Yersinia pestis PY-96]
MAAKNQFRLYLFGGKFNPPGKRKNGLLKLTLLFIFSFINKLFLLIK